MISFNSLVDGFVIDESSKYKAWLHTIVTKEHKKLVGEIVYIFMDDPALLKINTVFLKHDTYTDIITFNKSSNEEVISGEIYISIDRVMDNAEKNKIAFDIELARILVHGVLHLLGFNDQSNTEKAVMRSKEDYYLNLLP